MSNDAHVQLQQNQNWLISTRSIFFLLAYSKTWLTLFVKYANTIVSNFDKKLHQFYILDTVILVNCLKQILQHSKCQKVDITLGFCTYANIYQIFSLLMIMAQNMVSYKL